MKFSCCCSALHRYLSTLLCSVLPWCSALAAPSQQAGVADSSGHASTSGVIRCVSASGQPGGYTLSDQGSLRHFGGFVGGCTLLPTTDLDGDGISNELDADNDGDTLTDTQEVSGSPWLPASVASDRNNPDTDGDGFTDAAEAQAGTNPTDSSSGLWITDIQATSTDMTVTWLARHGKTYSLLHYNALTGTVVTSLVSTATADDPLATSPWYETTVSETDIGVLAGSATSGYYRVILEP